MVFNSAQFVIFFIVVYLLYLMLSHKWQNRMLLMASYVFYASWDWRFLSLILISTALDYFCGIKIDKAKDIRKKKRFLLLSIAGNLSILGFFKYFNFFSYNLQVMLNTMGLPVEPHLFRILLPIGISFYTFKTLSYTIEIYWGQMKPARNFLDYALFLAFFPALLSGPIDRAKSLLPQVLSKRNLTLDKFYEGIYLIFWGLFLKVFIADNLAKMIDPVFSSPPPYQGAAVLMTLYAYVFQLYCDFAGYTSIALGLGKIMGFDMMSNFNLPLFSTSIADFWRRWHISLSTWVRDYLFTPLFVFLRNIKVKGNLRLYLALFITMVLLGIWHGAGWNYVVFGIFEGSLIVLYQMLQPKLQKHIRPRSRYGKNIWLIARIVFMFQLTAIAFLIFRVQSLPQIFNMLKSVIVDFRTTDIAAGDMARIVFLTGGMIILEIIQYRKKDLMAAFKWNPLVRAAVYFICFYLLMIYGVEGGKEFIYAQF